MSEWAAAASANENRIDFLLLDLTFPVVDTCPAFRRDGLTVSGGVEVIPIIPRPCLFEYDMGVCGGDSREKDEEEETELVLVGLLVGRRGCGIRVVLCLLGSSCSRSLRGGSGGGGDAGYLGRTDSRM